MPLVAFSKLPTFERLSNEYHDVLSLDKAEHQDIRELHIGLLNMMPDATLQATERQFMRLVGDCNQIVQFYVHVFTLPSIKRGQEASEWIGCYYESFEDIKVNGLDALIISGANPIESSLEKEAFWEELTQVIDWAKENVTSTLCACLASHAVVHYLYNIKRAPLSEKRWGVFQHRLSAEKHPLIRHMNTRFDVPHSRYNEIFRSDLTQKKLRILAESEKAGVHLATSPDGIRFVFFQGHPEYDDFSLLKEYKREIDRWFENTRNDYPPFPENYFSKKVCDKLDTYRFELESYKQQVGDVANKPKWPESWLLSQLDNTWRDTALSLFNNWLGIVYQLTHKEQRLPFMDGVNPDNPLASIL